MLMPSQASARRPPAVRHQLGLSLIEVMVGITLGMLVAAGMLQLLANATGIGHHIQRSSQHIENGRYAAELLREEIQLAGYFGEVPNVPVIYTTPDPCSTSPASDGFSASPLGLPTAVRGYGAAEVLPCLAARQRLDGTDAIAVRRVDVTPIDPAGLAAMNAVAHLQHSFCASDPPALPMTYQTDKAALTLRNRSCDGPNAVRAFVPRLYYVAACSRCEGGGDGIPTLKRLDREPGGLVESALVEGVETLRVEYGFDTDANGSPDVYRTTVDAAGPASRWENVVTLRLHYVVRSVERSAGATPPSSQTFLLGDTGSVTTPADGFARRAYTTTVRLVNPSGIRELQ
jgi:type IV pilus assembly protein PilW